PIPRSAGSAADWALSGFDPSEVPPYGPPPWPSAVAAPVLPGHPCTHASWRRHHCGSCGKPMRTNYHVGQRPAYECSARADRLTTPTCRSIAASTVDEAVTELLLNALNPNEIALALAAADEVADRHQRVSRAAELAVDRARYEADRAERAFHAVEPDNRLVARSLE